MSITKRAPNTIHLGGPITYVNDLAAIETITPGMLVEYHNDSGVLKWGVHDSADEPVHRAVALEQIEFNKGVDDTYAAGDLVKVGVLVPGSQFWGLIPSGQNITQGARLQSNGNGMLKAAASGEVAFVAVESVDASALTTARIRVEVL
jgi:hypothetical protein